MVKEKGQTTQWLKKKYKRTNNTRKRTDNTRVKEKGQTTQWPKEKG